MIPKEIIDNSEDNKLVTFLQEVLASNSNTSLDIATAFFNVEGFTMIRDRLNDVKRFRLLLGQSPELHNEITLGEFISKEIGDEIQNLELSREASSSVQLFIQFLKRENVEIRLFERFLHGKAYIFNDLIVIGSSNFTSAGLTRYGELNTWNREAQAIYTRSEWFEKFWAQSIDFKDDLIRLLEDSRFGTRAYTPYEVYIKTLYEFQKEEVRAAKEAEPTDLPKTKVNLAQFQADAIARIWTRLEKFGGCIIADSVGLGKTWIAKKILEKIGYYERKNILIVCPAQLADMWANEMKGIDVKENVLSQESLASNDFLEKAKRILGGRLDDVELVVVDESHNFRNPSSKKWDNLFTLLNDHLSLSGRKPFVLFLTATPINNTLWDLYWQIMLLVSMNQSAFMKENISDLFQFFKEVEKNPPLLNDLLNEISIRRTRDYIKKNYPDAVTYERLESGELKERQIVFPERRLENVHYQLDSAYNGMYREISDIIANKLTMAYYRRLEYRKTALTLEEELEKGRMIAIGGIFKTILLKRLESSVEAFRTSISNHVAFLRKMKAHLSEGKLLTKQAYSKRSKRLRDYYAGYLLEIDEQLDDSDLEERYIEFNLAHYDADSLFKDIETDIELLKNVLQRVSTIKPKDDSKLHVLKNKLLALSKDGQIVLFTYYADTLNYVYSEIQNDEKFSSLRIEAISSSGITSKTSNQRTRIINDFSDGKINVLLSTDVLSEGQNLQKAKYLINYDLHWNPTRMIQRAGRIDRIGSPHRQIYVYNFFPEDELEQLLKLVGILQEKIIAIDSSIGLDQTVLGEVIHPKVFGVIIRKIQQRDPNVLVELEGQASGGGEMFYQPLQDFMRNRSLEELEQIPFGVHSGLKKQKKIRGIFFYYKYSKNFDFWYLYDLISQSPIISPTEILNYISCSADEERFIPDFFDDIYAINKQVLRDIERRYKGIELSEKQDSKMFHLSRHKSTKFIIDMIEDIQIEVDAYHGDYPNDLEVVESWEAVVNKLQNITLPPSQLKALRKIYREYKKSNNWKEAIKQLTAYSSDKTVEKKARVEPFDPSKLQLVTIDFVS